MSLRIFRLESPITNNLWLHFRKSNRSNFSFDKTNRNTLGVYIAGQCNQKPIIPNKLLEQKEPYTFILMRLSYFIQTSE